MIPSPNGWLLRLQELALRHSYLGLPPDLPALTLIELWGVYCLLSRIDGGGT
jgi:hypothetical protein